MKIKCRVCGITWRCGRDRCELNDRKSPYCPLCLTCYVNLLRKGGNDHPVEQIRKSNLHCYPKKEMDINPSRRDD